MLFSFSLTVARSKRSWKSANIDTQIIICSKLVFAYFTVLLTLDVFLVMYRTFVSSEELISLLIQRYLLFQSSIKLIATVDEKTREKICNVVISYLIRVVSRLSYLMQPLRHWGNILNRTISMSGWKGHRLPVSIYNKTLFFDQLSQTASLFRLAVMWKIN